jgi:hypothetical protein
MIVWQYGPTSVMGSVPNQLNNPNSAESLANGHILISDENNNRAIEVTRDLRLSTLSRRVGLSAEWPFPAG